MKLKSLLKEIVLFEISLDQIQTQFVDTGKLSPKDFEQIKDASGGDSAYATWLAARVVGSKRQRPIIKSEDIYKYKNYLATLKSRRREFPFTDINQIKSPQHLSQFISTAVDLRNQEEENPSKIKGASKVDKYSKLKIGEVAGFTVYKIPEGATQLNQVACDLGSGTKWCTAHSEAGAFKDYIKKDPLYIFDNGKGEKYQFHYEGREFNDKNNDEISITSPQILKFFKYLEEIGEKRIPLILKVNNPTTFKLTPEDFKEKNIKLGSTTIESLPDFLKKVEGDLDLAFSEIKSLPDDLEVRGGLYLGYSQIESLSNNLKVGGNLDLNSTPLKFIPSGLEVGGNLYLLGTPITSLPDSLEVGGDLSLYDTSITSLPKDLKVGGDLNLRNTPLSSKTEAEIRQMAPNVKGKIYRY